MGVTRRDFLRSATAISVGALSGIAAYGVAYERHRIDRIERFERTGEIGEPPAQPLPEPGRWFDDGDVARATVRLGPRARWVVERYPVDDVVEGDDGTLTVRLAVASERWLERLLLQLGPDAEVVAPDELRTLGASAARRLLARYRTS